MTNLPAFFRFARLRPRSRAAVAVPSRVLRARAAVAAAGVALVLILIVANPLIDAARIDAVDREYADRIERLRARLAETPDRPLFLMMGSSRMVMAFAPEQLPPLRDAAGAEVLPFNFSHFGAGPVFNRMVAGRLAREGVRPRWVVLEVMPAFFPRENVRFVSGQATLRDAVDCAGYLPFAELRWEWFRHRTAGFPGYAQRATRPPSPVVAYNRLGGYALLQEAVTPDAAALEIAVQAGHFGRHLKDWKAPPRSDRAFRDIVELFRGGGASVHVLLSPEGAEHRKLYGPGAADRAADYARSVAADLGLPFTDARDWLSDDDFSDGHHVLARGAARFTARLNADVIRPMLAGR